ncbi:MAG: hypothetical protein HYV97_04390 [Bdellovibrio sp.]|nr:hypothetical protein [Bdellovibrio sp.]
MNLRLFGCYFSIGAFSIVLLVSVALAETSPLCPDEEGYYYTNYRIRNPQKGGFVSNESFVDDVTDNVFIGPKAAICGSSQISGRAKIYGNAIVKGAQVSESAQVYDNAVVENSATVLGEAKIYGDALVSGSVRVDKKAIVAGNAQVSNESEDNLVKVTDNARVTGDATVTENAVISGNARVQGQAVISGNAVITGDALVQGCSKVSQGEVNTGTLNEQTNCNVVLTGNNFPESKHPYVSNETLVYKLPKAAMLKVTFDVQSATREGDTIVINGNEHGDGDWVKGKTFFFPGDTLTISIMSENPNVSTEWGFKITDIKGLSKTQAEAYQQIYKLTEELYNLFSEYHSVTYDGHRDGGYPALSGSAFLYSREDHDFSSACRTKVLKHSYLYQYTPADSESWEDSGPLDFRNIKSISQDRYRPNEFGISMDRFNTTALTISFKYSVPVVRTSRTTSNHQEHNNNRETKKITMLQIPLNEKTGLSSQFVSKFSSYASDIMELCKDPLL